ncbi:hypothetical protein M3194_15675 [Paenibacillus glycanilyticus]|uniref:hypothetical protein n=1 Tax=Paenibacillus glycanilyticus TaxID=126569 RepID=UPI00204252A3|nr:hypothetical protein [Paenibacillus glycanilyticus]MCM3628783.1 hypothetical protein [Paenibacillus glycanilyticus]
MNSKRYVLKTSEDFFYAIAAEKDVLVLSEYLIAGGKIQLANDFAVLIGDEYYLRDECTFFVDSD